MAYAYVREPVKREPPPKRALALAFIRAEIDAGRGFPSMGAISAHMGFKHPQSAKFVLDALAVYGHIRRVRGARKLTWELVP